MGLYIDHGPTMVYCAAAQHGFMVGKTCRMREKYPEKASVYTIPTAKKFLRRNRRHTTQVETKINLNSSARLLPLFQ